MWEGRNEPSERINPFIHLLLHSALGWWELLFLEGTFQVRNDASMKKFRNFLLFWTIFPQR